MRQFDFSSIAGLMGRGDKPLLTPENLGKLPHPLIEMGVLIPAEQATCVKCPCGEGHFENINRDIVYGDVSFSLFCCESGALYEISPKDLRQWTVSIPAIMKEIQSQFKCSGEPEKRCGLLWYLGESGYPIAQRRRQIFFAVRMTGEVERMLPEGTSQILIIGEMCPFPITKFQDRIFQMHEVMKFHGNAYSFDHDLIESRLQKIELAEKPKVKAKSKNAEQKAREEIIKEFLQKHIMSLRDACWTASGKDEKYKPAKRPSCQAIADYIKQVTNGKHSPNQSTVNRTIKESTDKELEILWKSAEDVAFIRYYKRKKNQVVHEESDEEYVSGMFSQREFEYQKDRFHEV